MMVVGTVVTDDEGWRECSVNWEGGEKLGIWHEKGAIDIIVDTISKILSNRRVDDYIDDNGLIGMSVRMEGLEKELDIGSGDVLMIGICGIGGSGKSTLASCICMKICDKFQGYCFIDNIREYCKTKGVKKLQEKMLSLLLNSEKTKLQDPEAGKVEIQKRLQRRSVLIILDDVDQIDQLDALVGSHRWFGSGTRVIITTREKQLLISHKVDKVLEVELLSEEESTELLNKRAYNEKNPVKDYEKLSSSVVSYAAGLPLALKVLGSSLYGNDENEWRSALDRLKENPEMKIIEKLKISYDGLKPLEKELFLDIACFFRWKGKDEAMEIFEACDYHPVIGIKTLEQKSLITTIDDKFDMHDLIQEMGHHIVKGDGDNRRNSEKHSRVWEIEDIDNLAEPTTENDDIEAMCVYTGVDASCFYETISKRKKLRWLRVYPLFNSPAEGPNFLSNELRYIDWDSYPRSPFPDTFRPNKLVVLKLRNSLTEELWKGYKVLPNLKVLELVGMENLVHTPNFDGLKCLQKLKILNCKWIAEIDPSLGNHTRLEILILSYCKKLYKLFPKISQMEKLKYLEIKECGKLLKFPEIKSNMKSLVRLYLDSVEIDYKLSSIGERCANLKILHLINCSYTNFDEAKFDRLKHLEDYISTNLHANETFHRFTIWLQPPFPHLITSLQKLALNDFYWHDEEISNDIGQLANLLSLSLCYNRFTRIHFNLSHLTRLKHLDLSHCPLLVEVPELPTRLASFRAVDCAKLTSMGDSYKKCKWLCQVSLIKGTIINDGSSLLEFMLQGNATENKNMVLELDGFKNAKEMALFSGDRCRLRLPENWRNDFSGLLMCTLADGFGAISMKQVMPMESDMQPEDNKACEEISRCVLFAWYVSFASLRHNAPTWWKSINNAHSISFKASKDRYGKCYGLGVRLVARKSGTHPMETLTAQEESEFSHYTPKFRIVKESESKLKIRMFA
ncbi:hypothetical protein E3N88_00761 [Mikania micrantha]|uniref:AAA+ ATPase domain-containing protein n=1 Tax=Mikania micrantha TaxID=192012 RepID=A0A5N6PZ29_9ASTR|nr:hypothetical protein E3N88_00761 [Mikania micrantha]